MEIRPSRRKRLADGGNRVLTLEGVAQAFAGLVHCLLGLARPLDRTEEAGSQCAGRGADLCLGVTAGGGVVELDEAPVGG